MFYILYFGVIPLAFVVVYFFVVRRREEKVRKARVSVPTSVVKVLSKPMTGAIPYAVNGDYPVDNVRFSGNEWGDLRDRYLDLLQKPRKGSVIVDE